MMLGTYWLIFKESGQSLDIFASFYNPFLWESIVLIEVELIINFFQQIQNSSVLFALQLRFCLPVFGLGFLSVLSNGRFRDLPLRSFNSSVEGRYRASSKKHLILMINLLNENFRQVCANR